VSTVEYESESGPESKLETDDAKSGVAKKVGLTGAKPAAQAKAGQPKVENDVATSVRPSAAAAVPAQQRGAIYTMMAHQALNVSELLNTGLAKKTIGKKDPRKLEVSEPNGPSTSGGKRARQSITMIAVSGEGGVLMCGWLDVAQKLAEVRPYDDVADQFKQRFGSKFEPTQEEYDKLIKDLVTMLGTMGFRMVEEEEEEEEEEDGPLGAHKKRIIAALAAVVVVGVLIALFR
jgi:hypothetical protein